MASPPQVEKEEPQNPLVNFFEEADEDGDGKISLEDLERVFGEELNVEELGTVFATLDKDGAGFITLDAFVSAGEALAAAAAGEDEGDLEGAAAAGPGADEAEQEGKGGHDGVIAVENDAADDTTGTVAAAAAKALIA
eukprot:g5208.t1